jgi:hypothetical protein
MYHEGKHIKVEPRAVTVTRGNFTPHRREFGLTVGVERMIRNSHRHVHNITRPLFMLNDFHLGTYQKRIFPQKEG